MIPSLTAPAWCPARPTRCRPLATDGGASIWTTRSIAPMSMPSSSDEVATSAANPAGFQQVFHLAAGFACQRSVMRPHERLAGQLVQRASQPLREATTVHEQQRRLMRANQLEQSRDEWRPRSTARRRQPGRWDLVRLPERATASRGATRAMSSTGTSIRSFSCFFSDASTTVTGRNRPASDAPSTRLVGPLTLRLCSG